MVSPKAVQTASDGRLCRQCGRPLPERPKSAKEHNFCPGTKCRSAWHREDKQKRLNAALEAVRAAWQAAGPERALLLVAIEELKAAGAK